MKKIIIVEDSGVDLENINFKEKVIQLKTMTSVY